MEQIYMTTFPTWDLRHRNPAEGTAESTAMSWDGFPLKIALSWLVNLHPSLTYA